MPDDQTSLAPWVKKSKYSLSSVESKSMRSHQEKQLFLRAQTTVDDGTQKGMVAYDEQRQMGNALPL